MWLPDIEIAITLPKGPFRIHPDATRTVGPLLCTHHNGQWWLAHPEGVRRGQLCPGAWVNLYEGIQADGTQFLMPVFSYANGAEPDTQPFLDGAVQLARKQWVEIKGVLHDDSCHLVPVEKNLPEPDGWSPHVFADLVDNGFGGRYLGSWRDVMIHILGAREFVVHTPRPDYFYWMRKQFDPEDTQLDHERGMDITD
ncbi:hypothetical protein [Propionivibrio sp.]|uniref:hypothetical protein n=1 Tax=Propionivibrio sp. TaxID=2212460 RepID=UPI0026315CCD|nr:hypothetical protein [Propionivibrio sp.]